MKIILPISIAILVGFFNIPFIYGVKKAYSQNPFIFAGAFNLCSAIFFLVVSYFYGGIEQQYFIKNWHYIVFAALGIFLINLAAFSICSNVNVYILFLSFIISKLVL